MATRERNDKGRFTKGVKSKIKRVKNVEIVDHNYSVGHVCYGEQCTRKQCKVKYHHKREKHVNIDSWKHGRRIVEFGVLLDGLKTCRECKLGPVPLTYLNVIGEMQKGLGGYLYVTCENQDCGAINRVPYGKTHRPGPNHKGMPCFAVNTKLGTAMVDSLGGPVRVNNFLATLNLKPINNKNRKVMERRAGEAIEKVADVSASKAAEQAFLMEMEDIAEVESQEAKKNMEGVIDDLGVSLMPDASPGLKLRLLSDKGIDNDSDWMDIHVDEKDGDDDFDDMTVHPVTESVTSPITPVHTVPPKLTCVKKSKGTTTPRSKTARGVKLAAKFPCKTRTGMSCAVDTAWHKRGFDSLTSHTFFMSKAKYGKKVLKTVVSHRTCGTCKWRRRNRPGQPVRQHRCVHSHTGSARLMESVSGEKGVKELAKKGTPVEYPEGDGDNTLIARLKSGSNINLKKRFDKNHIVKNIGKSLYALHAEKGVKLSKSVILHIQKCLKYIFAKNQGDVEGMKANLTSLIPHQFGDHSLCEPRWCGFRRRPGESYKHRSLPYKSALKDSHLRSRLERIFEPVIAKAHQFVDLGSSQQCEHANREVTLRAPTSLHYGNSESLDFRVKATAAFINDGRHYISQLLTTTTTSLLRRKQDSEKQRFDQAHSAAGLSPGVHSVRYADKCQEQRKRVQDRSHFPSTKRRRLILKQERSTTQGAQEALEGKSYESEIGHAEEEEVDLEQLPDPVPKGQFKPVKLSGEPTFITFDLETTDLIRDGVMPHITQLAAVEPTSGASFSRFVTPKVPITNEASAVTGIVVSGQGSMTVNGKQVQPVPVQTAVEDFLHWLENFHNVLLVAHNGRKFDFPVVISTLQKLHLLQRFYSVVSGLIDSIPLFTKAYPGRTSYKQVDLMKDILSATYGAHDALEDVEALGKLLSHSSNLQTVLDFSFPVIDMYNRMCFNKQKKKNMPSLSVLVASGVCKTPTAENIAGSGLQLQHLRTIFSRDGEDGLHNTFTVKNSDGQPRVTNAKRTLESVIPKLVDFFNKK